ncbi:MAG: DUF4136 domain-containing protein [Bacteroidia bacterium]|nr:DUF4136 domain-containing protein [Bacteroidia bacterium]
MKFSKLIILLFIVSSCATVNVNYDYDRETNFSDYKTYSYYSDMETGLSALDTKRLFAVLDSALEAKGITYSDSPDFYINIQSMAYENFNNSSVGIGVGGSGRNVGGGISVGIPVGNSNQNREIVFDFIDENGRGLFWQAVSDANYNTNASPEQREARLKVIVDKVLSGYPPQ